MLAVLLLALAASLAGVLAGPGARWLGLAVAAAAMGVALFAQAAVARHLGGLTGDVYGLGIEVAEAVALVAGCALVR